MKTKKKKKKKKKRSQPADNDNNYSLPITNHISLSISLLHCSSEEYCDCSIRVYRSFKQVFRGPFVGPPGAPFRLGPGEKCPSCPPPPPPPLWVALTVPDVFSGIQFSATLPAKIHMSCQYYSCSRYRPFIIGTIYPSKSLNQTQLI